MQTDVTTEKNFCNLFLTTNHHDCLPTAEDNSRFAVLFTRFRTNSEVKAWRAELERAEGRIYVDDLWDHIQKRPAQVLEAVMRSQLRPQYNPRERAPDTVLNA